jgi:hypothetical protein
MGHSAPGKFGHDVSRFPSLRLKTHNDRVPTGSTVLRFIIRLEAGRDFYGLRGAERERCQPTL